MSAQLEAALNQAIASLNAVVLVAHTDAATAAQLLAGAQASATTSQALVAQLTATLKAKGFNADGTPTTVTPPPPPPPPPVDNRSTMATASATIPGRYDLKPVNFTADQRRRDGGTPNGGDTGWSGLIIGGATPGLELTGLQKAVSTKWVVGLHDSVKGDWVETTITVPAGAVPAPTPAPTPPPPVTGKKKWGCYNGYGPSGWSGFNGKVGKTSTQHMSYVDTHDMSGINDVINFVKTSGAGYKLSLNVLIGEDGQFASQGERDRCRAIFKAIHAAGVGPLIQIRHMYEKNAAYGFPWQARSHGNDFAGANKLYDDIVLIGRQECPEMGGWIECMVPWDANQGEMAQSHSSLPGIIIGLDNYNSWGQNGYQQRGQVGISWAKSLGLRWSWDEYANRTPGNNGFGDDAGFVAWMKQATLDPACDSDTWYDSGDGGVDMILDGNSLAEFKKQLVLVGEAA